MKTTITLWALTLSVSGTLSAQNTTCPDLQLTDGMKLIYSVESAPPALYKMKGEYYRAKPKEQAKMKADWEKEPWNKDEQTNTVRIKTVPEGTFVETHVKRGKEATSALYFGSCNEREYIARAGFTQLDASGMPTVDFSNMKVDYVGKDSAKVTGFTILYDRVYPFKLDVGMKLPDMKLSYSVMAVNTQFTFEREKVLSTRVENRWVGNSANAVAFNYGQVVKNVMTEEITAKIESTSISETFLKNREVKDRKEVTVEGKTYTAYLIREETWTGSPMWTFTSDDEWVQKKNQSGSANRQKAVEDLLKKNENANEDGFIVTATEHWWIPQLGTFSLSSYDAFGSKVGHLQLLAVR
jgi:hypothetical protein